MIKYHWSDCAIYNAPAMEPGLCDCGYQAKVERRWFAWLYHLACNLALHQRNALRYRLRQLFLKQ